MKHCLTILLFCSLIFNPSLASSSALKKGLYFHSYEAEIDKRTALMLNNGKPYSLGSKDVFTLEFEVFLRNVEIQFGYIFRIISDKNENFDLLINNFKEVFFTTHRQHHHKKDIPFGEHILNIKLIFNKAQNEVILDLDGEIIVCPHDLRQTKSLLVTFGGCTVEPFLSNDVPPIILSNVGVRKNGKIINKWLFDRYSGNVAYDSISDCPAIFNNGNMLIENSLYWKKLGTVETSPFPQITFDSVRNQLLVLNDHECISFSIKDGSVSFTEMKNTPLDMYQNRFIFDYTSDRLLSYNIQSKRLNYYNPETASWGARVEEKADYSHHNRYISIKDSCLYLFGGYGHYQYKAKLFRINLNSQEWTEYDLSSVIMPRYLSAMGGNPEGDKLYILGGKGAEMGIQELSSHNVFDLHEIDLTTMKPQLINKLPEAEIENNYVFSNNLIVDEKGEWLYTLAFPNNVYSSYALLKKISLTKPVVETYGDTLRFNFYDVSSVCNLFYSPSLSKLIAVFSSADDNLVSTVEVYTIDFHPLNASDVYRKSSSPVLLIIAAVLILLAAAILLVYIRKRKKREKDSEGEEDIEENLLEDDMQYDTETKFYERRKSSILFMGGFQVFDKDGKDITEDFTPILKYLLILIILNTQKNQKGISSTKLEELLWAEKSEEAARNNRNVNVRKLRKMLENVGEFEIENKANYWSISLPDNVLSDFLEIMTLLESVRKTSSCDSENLKRFVELLSYGEILPNTQNEWVDPFKSDFANEVVDALLPVLAANANKTSISRHHSFLLKIADVISIFDPLNETAATVKCRIFYEIGKKGLAQKVYNSFVRDYKTFFAEDYKKSLKTLLEQK